MERVLRREKVCQRGPVVIAFFEEAFSKLARREISTRPLQSTPVEDLVFLDEFFTSCVDAQRTRLSGLFQQNSTTQELTRVINKDAPHIHPLFRIQLSLQDATIVYHENHLVLLLREMWTEWHWSAQKQDAAAKIWSHVENGLFRVRDKIEVDVSYRKTLDDILFVKILDLLESANKPIPSLNAAFTFSPTTRVMRPDRTVRYETFPNSVEAQGELRFNLMDNLQWKDNQLPLSALEVAENQPRLASAFLSIQSEAGDYTQDSPVDNSVHSEDRESGADDMDLDPPPPDHEYPGAGDDLLDFSGGDSSSRKRKRSPSLTPKAEPNEMNLITSTEDLETPWNRPTAKLLAPFIGQTVNIPVSYTVPPRKKARTAKPPKKTRGECRTVLEHLEISPKAKVTENTKRGVRDETERPYRDPKGKCNLCNEFDRDCTWDRKAVNFSTTCDGCSTAGRSCVWMNEDGTREPVPIKDRKKANSSASGRVSVSKKLEEEKEERKIADSQEREEREQATEEIEKQMAAMRRKLKKLEKSQKELNKDA